MNINELKEYVDAKIKENGRQEITGPILNKVLNSAIDTLDDTASAEVAEAVEKLQSAIDSEASTRESADTAIAEAVEKLQAIPIAKGTGEGSLRAGNLANSASGKYACAEGDLTKAEQRGAHAEGASTIANAIGTHAEGESTTASGRASHAEGYMSKTSGKYSHSEGFLCDATGESGHAEGYLCKAIGERSHAEGSQSAATGTNSPAEGTSTIASTSGAHAEGIYNEDDDKLIHSVGIGRGDSARKNAEAIYTDGKKYIYGVGDYDGTKASIANGAKDVATVVNEITPQKTTADIDTLTTAKIAPYYHNASTTISGTLPDGVTNADRFRLEVLPLGDSYVEQRMTVPTNGSVAVYTRIWSGSSWGAWI